jgi:prephenate dehydrogenase
VKPIKRLAIIGLGLIGGSLARALRDAGMVEHVVSCGRSAANLEKGVELGVIDSFTHDVAEAVSDADVVFVSVPLGAMASVFEAFKSHIKPECVITDGGSAKATVIEDFMQACPEYAAQFVPGHPIAGTENNGVEASFATLYNNRRIILTPMEQTSADAQAVITEMWQACGAEVIKMGVEHHDEVLAATSHLPHMLAFGLVDMLANLDEHDDIFKYAAGGFRDFTRIASSNPVMWRDICVANRRAVSELVFSFAEELQSIGELIEQGEGKSLLEIFENAKSARDAYVDGLDENKRYPPKNSR